MKRWIENNKTIIEILISFFSVILVLLTLNEMKAERNATYRPDLFVSEAEFAVVWDESGFQTNDEKELFESISKAIAPTTVINAMPKIRLCNLGVGTAKNIKIDWNIRNNFKEYFDVLKTKDDIDIFLDKNNQLYIKENGIEQSIGTYYNNSYDFLLNSNEEHIDLLFPLFFYKLNLELIQRNIKIPNISIKISYVDVQNKDYFENISIGVETYFGLQNENGSGGYVLNLITHKEKNMHNSVSFLGFTTEEFTAITSFFAVIISVISVCFTYKSNKNQMEHNRNSVKPISSIKVLDYENKIAVKIFNYGTGPLIIKDMIVKNETEESDRLLALMPNINQSWTTFTGSVNGSKIPVDGCITLIELNPKNEETKTSVRMALKDITIYLEYTDIYSTTFTDSKKLDFFGRHF